MTPNEWFDASLLFALALTHFRMLLEWLELLVSPSFHVTLAKNLHFSYQGSYGHSVGALSNRHSHNRHFSFDSTTVSSYSWNAHKIISFQSSTRSLRATTNRCFGRDATIAALGRKNNALLALHVFCLGWLALRRLHRRRYECHYGDCGHQCATGRGTRWENAELTSSTQAGFFRGHLTPPPAYEQALHYAKSPRYNERLTPRRDSKRAFQVFYEWCNHPQLSSKRAATD